MLKTVKIMKRRRKAVRRGKTKDHIERFDGNVFIGITTPASGVMNFDVFPTNFGARCTAMSDVFQQYRFVHMRVQPINWTTPVTAFQEAQFLAYTPDANVTATLQSEVAEISPVIAWNANLTTMVPSLELSKAELGSNIKWWNTRLSAGADDQFEYQGLFLFARGTAAAGFLMARVDYTVEFRAFLPPTLTSLPPEPSLQPVVTRRSWADYEDDEKSLIAESIIAERQVKLSAAEEKQRVLSNVTNIEQRATPRAIVEPLTGEMVSVPRSMVNFLPQFFGGNTGAT